MSSNHIFNSWQNWSSPCLGFQKLARFSPGSSEFWQQIWKSFGDFKAWLFVFGRKLSVLAIVTTSVVLRKVPKWWSVPNLAELLDNLRKKMFFTSIVQMRDRFDFRLVKLCPIIKCLVINFFVFFSRLEYQSENQMFWKTSGISSICSWFSRYSKARESCDNWSR